MGGALGLIETKGLITAIEAADVMVKTADVKIKEFRIVGSGLVNISIQGNVAAVQAAIETGVNEAKKIGEIISFYVIARPHEEMLKVIP